MMTLYEYLIDNRQELIAQWDEERNNELGLTMNSIGAKSDKESWWKCEKHPSYKNAWVDKRKGVV